MAVYNTFNIALKIAILRSGKRQIDIADKAGIDPGLFSHIINGRRPPTKVQKSAIARVLRKPIGEIFPELPDEATA